MIKSFKKNLLLCTAILASAVTWAQDAAPVAVPVTTTSSSDNTLLYLLITACVVMLLAAFLLGNVWVKLAKLAFDKRAGKTAAILFLLLSSNFLFAQDAVPVADTSFKLPMRLDLIVGIFVFAIEMMVVIWMLLGIRKLIVELSPEKETVKKPFALQLPHIFDNINASVPIEKERDILLDHNYDGIRELDNSLPPWWKYSFYLSIIWAFFYLAYYYVGGGPSTHDEYIAEIQQAKIDVDAYNKKNSLNVDESNVKFADAAGIADGQDIYKNNCAACHGNFGEGNVGPNLTDDYFIHGGTANELFKTVKYGWPAKGMKSWETDLSAVQIKNVISYIHSIHGTNPANAKAPQGDLFTEAGIAKTDSTVVAATDTTQK
ncbi:MAG: c-type cytochrome [Chitinophagales bacterium]|nr:c-type cytochrome [Chitinophagales bacterium]